MARTSSVLVVGLDGATWSVLDSWLCDGTLPNLARVRASGVSGALESTLPPLTPPAWASFLTGKNPGKHGVFHFTELDGESLDASAGARLVDSTSIRSSTLWDILGHHGRRLVTINVPMSYPPRPVNGAMLTCLLTPPDAPVFTYPAELSELLPDYRIDLDRFIGEKPFARDESGERRKRTVEPSIELVEEFRQMEEIRGRTALDLMASEPWDVFTVVFTAPDRMGHYLWPYHFPPAENSVPEHAELHDAVRGVYRVIDDAIGRLVERAGPEVHVVVLSDHGMGAAYTKNAHWNTWLYRRGLVAVERRTSSRPDALLLRLGISRDRIGKAIRRIPSLGASRVVARARALPTAGIDRRRSTAYYVRLFDPLGGIHINATGRERERIRAGLRDDLATVTDPETGRPVLSQIVDREEAVEGPYAERLPDLLLLMDPAYGSSDRLTGYSSVVTDRATPGDPGGHRMEGILALAGPGIGPGGASIGGARIVDVAPTILHLLDLPIPDDLDGRVLTQALAVGSLGGRPIRIGPPLGRWPTETGSEQGQASTHTHGDEQVRDRLRALGYVE